MYNSDTRTITTERLVLRPFQLADAERVSELCNNVNIYKSTLSLPYPYTIESALSWIPTHEEKSINDSAHEFAITNKITGELYGAMGLFNNRLHNNGEVGYWIGEEYWGNGYATEALKSLINFAFTEKGYHKVYGRFFATNPASGKVMEKVGMVKEGLLKEHILKDNKYLDLVHCGIINPDDN